VIAVTTGAVALDGVLLYANLRPWLKTSDRDPRALAPFGGGLAMGALSTLCTGGVLGVLALWLAGSQSRVGGHLVPGSTGQPDSTMARGDMGHLTAGGGQLTSLGAAALAIAWRATGKGDAGKAKRRRMAGGVLCGVSLGATVAVASILRTTLVAAVNSGGDQLLTALNHPVGL
jgi:hypothetical protein